MSFTEQVATHEKAVLQSTSKCYHPVCPLCNAPPPFSRHEIRRRSFRRVDGDSVLEVRSWIVRWWCRACHRTFTDYPAFALPYKRFVKDTIVQLSTDFIGIPDASYDRVTAPDGAPIEYDTNLSDSPVLSRSTLWRWVSWLGNMPQTLHAATQLLYQKRQNLTLHRDLWTVEASKYRSDSRQLRVQNAFRTLVVCEMFDRVFSAPLFPTFATACGFR